MAFVLTLSNLKGGVGKSSICSLLGVAAEKAGLRTAWFDNDPQGTLTFFHSRRIASQGNARGPYLAAKPPNATLEVMLDFFRGTSEFDLVIVDTRPVVESDVLVSLKASHAVLIPLRPAPADLHAVSVIYALCREYKCPYRFVLNDARKTKLREHAIIELSKLGGICQPVLGTRASYERMIGTGITPLDGGSDQVAQEEVAILWHDVWEWIKSVMESDQTKVAG